MYVMGTAGHVDHGKSSLVLALSGIDPDRLPEEKERGLTIDLGFAWMTTNSGLTIGIVDVPGHERFVKNMIAGVGAIDFVLFVVAADDGWMPQSTEHLAILKYLNVKRGLVAVTKKALADPDWLQLVIDDVRQKTADTFLRGAPIIAVDSLSGDGIDELKSAIDQIVQDLPPSPDIGKPRLYIDRAFTIAGRGAVVTGTLTGGTLNSGQNLRIVPGDLRARVRELQMHGKPAETAAPGQRVAVNLAGIETGDLHRGQCLVAESDAATVDRLWASVNILVEAAQPLKAERTVLVMLGTAEPEASAYPIEPTVISPGGEGLVELRLSAPIKARLGDHFVLRWPTPQVTIGGGTVLDVGGTRHLKRDPQFIALLQRRRDGSLQTYCETEIAKTGYARHAGFLDHAPYSHEHVLAALHELEQSGRILLTPGWILDLASIEHVRARVHAVLATAHRERPSVAGINLAHLAEQIGIESEAMAELTRLLEAEGAIARTSDAYHLPSHQAQLPPEWSDESQQLWRALTKDVFQPPLRNDLEALSANGRAIVGYWVSTQKVVAIGGGVIFPTETFSDIRQRVVTHFTKAQELSAAELRDMLGTTRKYAVPILEALDREGVTRRVGDVRVRGEQG